MWTYFGSYIKKIVNAGTFLGKEAFMKEERNEGISVLVYGE